jgi:uncharacterized protein with HEPN domain
VSPRDWHDRIRDILDAIAEIQKFTHGMDHETFKGDEKLMWDTVQNDLPPLIPELEKLL